MKCDAVLIFEISPQPISALRSKLTEETPVPIYEYHCLNCGHEKEMLRNLSEAPLTLCPECGKETFQKKISAAGFQLKGSGWYETDFKDKKPAQKDKAAATDSPASPDSSTSADQKTKTETTEKKVVKKKEE